MEKAYDDEQPQKEEEIRGCGATSPQPMDDYPGSPHDLSLLTMYHVHMVKNMSDVIVRFYNFNVFV